MQRSTLNLMVAFGIFQNIHLVLLIFEEKEY